MVIITYFEVKIQYKYIFLYDIIKTFETHQIEITHRCVNTLKFVIFKFLISGTLFVILKAKIGSVTYVAQKL